jgi:DNA replication protein DnaC
MIAERLPQLLDTLGLADVQAILDTHLERAAKEQMTYAEFLAQLLECEASARRERLLQTRTRMARLPVIKTLDQFDFGFQPSIDQRQIREMQTLRFLHDHSNAVFLGPPGVGKTHLSIALAVEAIQSGHSAYFTTAYDLVSDLSRAVKEHRFEKRMRVYVRPDLLIIDEMGYLPLEGDAATILFQLVTARYERGSILLTSNKSYVEWDTIFGDPGPLTPSLRHHQHTRRQLPTPREEESRIALGTAETEGRNTTRRNWGFLNRRSGDSSTAVDTYSRHAP